MNLPSLSHPEYVNGRRLWIDPVMSDLIDRLHHGDPTIGWEGDERLAVYYDRDERRWEIWRLEDDGVYRMVCRSAPDVVFDQRILWRLCEWDRNRRTRTLVEEVVAHNERLRSERNATAQEYMAEEVAPRLRHAIQRE